MTTNSDRNIRIADIRGNRCSSVYSPLRLHKAADCTQQPQKVHGAKNEPACISQADVENRLYTDAFQFILHIASPRFKLVTKMALPDTQPGLHHRVLLNLWYSLVNIIISLMNMNSLFPGEPANRAGESCMTSSRDADGRMVAVLVSTCEQSRTMIQLLFSNLFMNEMAV